MIVIEGGKSRSIPKEVMDSKALENVLLEKLKHELVSDALWQCKTIIHDKERMLSLLSSVYGKNWYQDKYSIIAIKNTFHKLLKPHDASDKEIDDFVIASIKVYIKWASK